MLNLNKYIRENIYHFKECKKKNDSKNEPKSSQVECQFRKRRKIIYVYQSTP